jgi:tetratricopeptide (TPR) repeat protein
MQVPARTGHVNDFAGVVDEKTRLHLEDVLENVKQKTGIEFVIATVESTSGQEIFVFSRQIASQWDIGVRTSPKKSLLLVVSAKERQSFALFSKSAQSYLPEGVLGALSQGMRTLVNSGKFSEGLNAGIQRFVSVLAEKLAINPADFDKTPERVSDKPIAMASPLSKSGERTRPRVVKPLIPPASEANAVTVKTASPGDQPRVVKPLIPPTTSPHPATVKTSAPRDEKISTKTNDADALKIDEDESEEVELTLTLPLEDRIAELKAFMEQRPDSKSKPRAIEILISAYAALGDQKLKKGDSAGGTKQLMLAIVNAPVNISEKLFSGVISQIPLNLYLRGEGAAALKAAQDIEAKFGSDPKRLLAISAFYVGTEQGGEATRIATRAVSLAPELAEAHQGLGLALHISLRLDEAAAEYKRALELDPNSKVARRGLADLSRALGKSEQALVLYREELVAEPTDKAARAGLVLSLLELGRRNEAKNELEAALKTDPRNLSLLAGTAYWFAAHNESEMALAIGNKAIEIEPRYTWSQVAVARALTAQRKPLEAERAVRFARQFGKFPTLEYELASALVSAGLYGEASEILMQSFTVKDGQIEAQLAGRAAARAANFMDLLAPERRASIFQFAAADTENNARLLKALLTFSVLTSQPDNGGTVNEADVVAAAREFASGDDAARVYRQLYAAGRLLQRGIGFQTVYELAEAARSSAEDGMSVPALTVAIQADEYRDIRARAIASGGTPDIPEAPRNVLSNLLRGRIEDLSGWARFNQDKLDEAVDHLRRAVNVLPEGTPASRNSMWHLGAALERQDKKEEALVNYIKSYNAGEPDPVRRTVIEKLYRKIHGSLTGLDQQIDAAETAAASAQAPIRNDVRTDAAAVPAQSDSSAGSSPTSTSVPITGAAESPTPSAIASPVSSPPPATEPSPEKPTVTTPAPEPALERIERTDKPQPRGTVTIAGQVKDSSSNPITNVVVVIISPQGVVLTSTTDSDGNYSFTLAPSDHGYRIIPSREGFTFEPVDRILPGVSADQKRMDFAGIRRPAP